MKSHAHTNLKQSALPTVTHRERISTETLFLKCFRNIRPETKDYVRLKNKHPSSGLETEDRRLKTPISLHVDRVFFESLVFGLTFPNTHFPHDYGSREGPWRVDDELIIMRQLCTCCPGHGRQITLTCVMLLFSLFSTVEYILFSIKDTPFNLDTMLTWFDASV